MLNQLPICEFGQDVILCSQPIYMNLHLIKNMKSPVNKFDAVDNAYADRIKYKTAIGNIPTTVITVPTLFTFPAAKAFARGKIIIWDVGWPVGSWVDCNIQSNVCNFVAWLSQVFQRSVPYDLLHWFPTSGWICTFRFNYIELLWVSLYNYNHNILF